MDTLGESDVILFQDEASVQFAPTITRMWSLKEQQPEILTYGGRKRQPLIGAVEPLAGRIHTAFFDTLKTEQFQHFLEGLLARYPDAEKLLLILDNARVHHSKDLEPFLEAHKDKLELMYLPPYSPDLNPMEWIWKKMRKEVTHNTFFENFKNFQRALIKFFNKFKLQSLEIKSLCCFANLFNAL